MAEALVLRQQRKGSGATVQLGELGVVPRTAGWSPASCRSRAATSAGRSSCGYVRLSPTISSRASAWRVAIGLNARIRSGRCRRLKIDPTKSTSGSRRRGPARRRKAKRLRDRCSAHDLPPGRNAIRISRRAPSETVSTKCARSLDHRVISLRRRPSFQRNHSGCATNEMS